MKHQKYIFDFDNFTKDLLTKRVVELRIGVRDAAKQIGISPSTLSRLENKHLPDVYTYFYVCRWLGSDLIKYFKKQQSRK